MDAQEPPLQPRMKVHLPSSYQAHHQVLSVERDPQGGMWFGTAGTVLYNTGEDWMKVPTEPGMGVFAIDIDEKGRVWIGGTSSFGLLRPVPPEHPSGSADQKGVTNRWMGRSRAGMDTAKSEKGVGELEYVSLVRLLPDSLKDFGNVWNVHATDEAVVFNSYQALFIVRKGPGEASPKGQGDTADGKREGSRIEVLRPRNEFRLCLRSNGDLWVQDKGHGLFRLELGADGGQGKARLTKLPESGMFGDMLVRGFIGQLPGRVPDDQENPNGTVLVVTQDDGLYFYHPGPPPHPQGERIVPFAKERWPILKKVFLKHGIPLEPSDNPYKASLALSTLKSGVMLLDSAGRIVLRMDQGTGWPADFVWGSARGAPGSGWLWSATDKGIVGWAPEDPRTFALEGKAFSGGVNDITGHRGQLFIATDQGVYFRQDGKESGKSSWHSIQAMEGKCQDLLHVGRNDKGSGSLLVAGPGGLFELKPRAGKSGKVEWMSQIRSDKNPHTIAALPRTLEKRWVASAGREGIVLLCREEEGWKEQIHLKGLPEGAISLKAFAEGAEKEKGTRIALWVGLRSKGAFKLILDPKVLTRAKKSEGTQTLKYEELSGERIKGLSFTPFIGKGKARRGLPKGNIHFFSLGDRPVATTEEGLYRPSKGVGKDPHWVPDTSLGCRFGKCPGKKGKRVQDVFCLKEDQDGSIWIQSGHPYHLIPKSDGEYRIDSLPFKGMDIGDVTDFFLDSNGITWMGADNGLVRYDEKVEKEFERKFPCLIKGVSTPLQDSRKKKRDSLLFGGFYRKSAPSNAFLDWEGAWEQPESFVPTLSYGMNDLSFRFAAPYYEKQEKVTYSYQLEGYEKGWSQWKKETRKEYTNLPEGNYEFQVKAKNVYGIESKIAEYRFRILPPWYRTWTAYGGYTVAGVGLIWLLLWLNSRRLIAQKQRLEGIVAERTKEIQEEKEKVEKKNRALEEANETISKQKEEVEEAHQEITQSIDYAQKIQHALLQSEEQVSPHLYDHFILFKPQSQVSGDFYWAREHKGYLYIAAVDCTGHGVPGAFMSMLGISQLNEIMANDEVLTPGEVLTQLRDRVVRELSGSSSGETAKDGMDAAMVKIPLENSNSNSNSKEGVEIEFAGAQNPLYVIRKGIGEDPPSVEGAEAKPFKKSPDGIEIKGDPMPVGYDEYATGDFTTATLELREGDMLYLFSDGYADQFGGPKGKKFRYGPFKKLLADLQEKPLEEQKAELDRVFENWKHEGKQEQIDDVVVIGIRV